MSFLKISINEDFSEILRKKMEQAGPVAAHAVAARIAKDTEPFVPALNKSLVNRTQVVENSVVYPGPYARYLYYGKVMVYEDPPYEITRPDGKKVLTHYGQRKKPIDKPLKINKSVHPQAQAHWFEASKAQNIEKWAQAAEEAIARELK